eukprot:6458322-Amphidinium_carterae.1
MQLVLAHTPWLGRRPTQLNLKQKTAHATQLQAHPGGETAQAAQPQAEVKGDLDFKVTTSNDPDEPERSGLQRSTRQRWLSRHVLQDNLTGCALGDWANHTASPFLALDLSKKLGIMAPLGLWDPAGFLKVDDYWHHEPARRRDQAWPRCHDGSCWSRCPALCADSWP